MRFLHSCLNNELSIYRYNFYFFLVVLRERARGGGVVSYKVVCEFLLCGSYKCNEWKVAFILKYVRKSNNGLVCSKS